MFLRLSLSLNDFQQGFRGSNPVPKNSSLMHGRFARDAQDFVSYLNSTHACSRVNIPIETPLNNSTMERHNGTQLVTGGLLTQWPCCSSSLRQTRLFQIEPSIRGLVKPFSVLMKTFQKAFSVHTHPSLMMQFALEVPCIVSFVYCHCHDDVPILFNRTQDASSVKRSLDLE